MSSAGTNELHLIMLDYGKVYGERTGERSRLLIVDSPVPPRPRLLAQRARRPFEFQGDRRTGANCSRVELQTAAGSTALTVFVCRQRERSCSVSPVATGSFGRVGKYVVRTSVAWYHDGLERWCAYA